MGKSAYPLKLPVSVKKAALELAASDGVSLNQFIAAAVAEKVGVCGLRGTSCVTAAGRPGPRDMLKYLRCAPKIPLSAEDQQ